MTEPSASPLATSAPPPPLRVTGTLVAQYFRLRCERQLRYDLVPPEARGGDVPPPEGTDPISGRRVGASPGMRRLAESGREWERRRVARFVGRTGDATIRSAEVDAHGNLQKLPVDDVLATLRAPGPARYLLQPELRLRAPAAFLARYGIDAAALELAPAQPDLIRLRRDANNRLRLGVVDLKSSREGTLGHFAQVAFYTLLLEDLCREHALDAAVETRWGWLWLRGARGLTRFPLAAYRHHVAEFLRCDLARLARLPARAAAWHVMRRCGACRYLEHCRAEADVSDDLARVVGISPLAKRALAARGIGTVRALSARALRADTFTGCKSLEDGADVLRKRVQAMRFGKAVEVGATHLLGPAEGARVFVGVEVDPVSARCFALTLRLDDGRAAPRTVVFTSSAPAREREIVRRAADELTRWLRGLPADSRSARGGVRAFVWDRRELAEMRALAVRHLADPALGPLLAPLVEALHAPGSGGVPGTVLLDAVTELFAPPVPYVYTLAGISAALRPSSDAIVFRAAPDVVEPFGSGISFVLAREMWSGGAKAGPARTRIEAAAAERLAAMDSVLRAVRERAGPRGKLLGGAGEAPSARSDTPLPHPLLDALLRFARLEAATEAAMLRALHALPVRERARRFECIRGMEFVAADSSTGRLVFEFDPACREAKFRPGDFALVLTNEGTDGLARVDRNPWLRRKLMMELVEYQLAADPPRVVLAPSAGFAKAVDAGEIHLDRQCVIDRAAADFNTERVAATLRALSSGDGAAAAVLALLEARPHPVFALDLDAARRLLRDAAALRGGPVLNTAQKHAWTAALRDSCTVVWGPPGTGKTYLLAWTLLGLAAAPRGGGRPVRVLVTAATHRAVVTVLKAVAREMAHVPASAAPRLVKLRGSGNPADDDLRGLPAECIADDELPARMAAAAVDGAPLIVGGTVWSLWKQMRRANRADVGTDSPVRPWFDVVVIDEASQMKLADSLIALSALRKDGRVIVCGDDRQLAPIIHSRAEPDGAPEPGAESAFAYFAARYPRRMLRESRRMNAALVGYPRELFYPGLISRVPDQRLCRADDCPPGADALDALLWEIFFGPDDAAICCTYDGISAGASNPFEADLVARLARLARHGLREPATGAPLDTTGFRDRGFAVLAPHRAQNGAIAARLLEWGWPADELPVIDTVERMQGNEREMIVVSYAVADVEYAEREAAFLLDPNRFNVAATRARSKLVVLVSEAVLRALPDDEAVMSGSMALKGFVAHCDDRVREAEIPAPDGTRVPVRLFCRTLSAALARPEARAPASLDTTAPEPYTTAS